METPEKQRPPTSTTVRVCTIVFLAIGIGGYQLVAPRLFAPPSDGGIDVTRVMWAAVVGGLSAIVGSGTGKLVDRLRS